MAWQLATVLKTVSSIAGMHNGINGELSELSERFCAAATQSRCDQLALNHLNRDQREDRSIFR
ncbi:MAG: hypothetical protein NXI04_25990 [Planctomycetaceae bacterium]|nr:hypothetical protein [Planctomycetaceae bacterium]